MSVKKGIIISDLHCGGQTGLTPPEWRYNVVRNAKNPSVKKKNKVAKLQKEVWEWYVAQAKSLGPLDFMLVNGDCIDGSGKINAGVEQIDTDTNIQCAMAVESLEQFKLRKGAKIVMTYGSAYHTGKDSDHEDIIASALNADIGSHKWVDINGCVFDLKHVVGRSSVPHTKGTALAREWLVNELWALKGLTPKTDVYIRSHVHYPWYCGDPSVPFLAMTTPALQWGTAYGSRSCTGTVDMGFIYFEINDKGEYTWQYRIAHLESQRALAVKV